MGTSTPCCRRNEKYDFVSMGNKDVITHADVDDKPRKRSTYVLCFVFFMRVSVRNLYSFTRQSAGKTKLHGKKNVSDMTNEEPVLSEQYFVFPSLQAHLTLGPLIDVPITRTNGIGTNIPCLGSMCQSIYDRVPKWVIAPPVAIKNRCRRK